MLLADFAALERIRELAGANHLPAAGSVATVVERDLSGVTNALHSAGADYKMRATNSLTQATLGSAAVIFILLGGLALLYRRSCVLLEKNHLLLATSRSGALTDVLTGLGNRRAFMAHLKDMLSRRCEGSRLALVLLNLDGFKRYNDSFGHPAGDALLTRLAGRLSETVAGIGIVYRIGGDEFCVLAELDDGGGDGIARLAAAALNDHGEGFDITSLLWPRAPTRRCRFRRGGTPDWPIAGCTRKRGRRACFGDAPDNRCPA